MIDEIDRKILDIIQRNARISNAEIARRIGMTTSGVFERVKKLEKKRVIRGYKTVIDPKALGMDLVAFVFMKIRPTRGVIQIGRRIAQMTGVQEVFRLAGEEGLLCKVRCPDMNSLEILLDQINDIETVVSARATIAFRTIKETSEVPTHVETSFFELFSVEEITMESSPAFEKTYNSYMDQIADLRFEEIADRLGVRKEEEALIIPFYDESYTVSKAGVVDTTGKRPHLSISVVLFRYMLSQPAEIQAADQWVSFKDFKDAAPFVGAFAYNAEKAVSRHFSGKLDALERACFRMGGQPAETELPYQLTVAFHALPRVPVLLLFNDEDDEFSAKSTILFKRNADQYLDMECLGIIGWLLADRLKHYGEKRGSGALEGTS